MKKKFKGTPMYDPATDKILNCKKNSLVWWHEKGHQYWYKLGIEGELQYNYILCFFSAITLVVLDIFRLLAVFLIVLAWGLFALSEIHAWWYAFRHYKK